MKLTHQFVDLKDFDGDKAGPRILVKRKANEVWYVPENPVNFDHATAYRQTRFGESVLVPLMRTTVPRSLEGKMAFMAAIGSLAMVPAQFTPVRMHVVVGTPVREVGPDDELWIGFAFQV